MRNEWTKFLQENKGKHLSIKKLCKKYNFIKLNEKLRKSPKKYNSLKKYNFIKSKEKQKKYNSLKKYNSIKSKEKQKKCSKKYNSIKSKEKHIDSIKTSTFSKKFCSSELSKKIGINIKEKKYISRKQAIAVAYSQINKKYPKCIKYFQN